MEDDLNQRHTQWKPYKVEAKLNGRNLDERRPQWKMTSMEDNLNRRQPQLKMTLMEDDLNIF